MLEPFDREERRALADGTRVTIRPLRPDDRDELRRRFADLSSQTRYRRFLSVPATLSDDAIRYLTEIDGVDHVAIVCTTESLDRKRELGLGVARYVRLEGEPDVAEAAVVVADDAQRRGVGRLLLTTLAEAARERGVRAFRAEVLAENTPMRRILEDLGATVRRVEGDTITFDVDLGPPPEVEAGGLDQALRRVFRAIAESFAIGRSPE
jgi:GNAT superfamily N-acetyltransferase